MLTRRLSSILPLIGAMLLIFILIGCAGNSPVTPDPVDLPDATVQASSDTGNNYLLGSYTIIMRDIEDENGNWLDTEFEVVPQRLVDTHFNVSTWIKPPACPDCVTIQAVDVKFDWDGIIYQVTVLFKNPIALTGWDVRGIIYPPAGMASIENFDREPCHDGLTTLYSGDPPSLNPYMAFNKEETFRPFTGPNTVHGTTYFIWKATEYKLLTMDYKVSASWAPGPWAPGPNAHNADEPVNAYIAPIAGPIHPAGSQAEILAVITDWQNNINHVTLDLASLGHGIVEMEKISEDPANYVSTWRYILTEGAGYPDGKKIITLTAYDQVATLTFNKEFAVYCTHDLEGPEWAPGDEYGIYDHIAGPQLLWLFYHEAIDGSKPIEYIFHGASSQQTFTEENKYKVENTNTYTGYTNFGQDVGAPANIESWFGINLKDAQGNYDEYPDLMDYTCTRYGAELRWTFIKDQPPNMDGILGSPTLGNVDNDPSGSEEIALGARNHKVYVYGGSGTGNQDTILWEYETGGEIQCTPALVDLNNDSWLDVVIASDDVNVYALSGQTGLPLWIFDAGEGFLMHASPAIGYANGDMVPDVFIGTGGGTMYALDGTDGSEIWSHETEGGIAGTPAVADVTGDGTVDVCFGSYDTRIHMVNGANGYEVWTYYVGPGMNNIDCSPVMVPLNGDNVPDVVIGFRDNTGDTKAAIVALDGVNGENEIWYQGGIWGNARRGAAPVHDINGDGVWDFVITAYQAEVYTVYGLSGADGNILYRRLSPSLTETMVMNYSAPIVGDFTGDGHMNAIWGRLDGYVDLVNIGDIDYPYPEDGGWGGVNLEELQISSGNKQEIYGTPAMGDVDGDGEWELVVCNMRGFTYITDMFAPIPDDIEMRGWTQHAGNRWNTGTPEFVPPK